MNSKTDKEHGMKAWHVAEAAWVVYWLALIAAVSVAAGCATGAWSITAIVCSAVAVVTALLARAWRKDRENCVRKGMW